MDILGTKYSIIQGNEEEYPKLKDKWGYCDVSTKKIVVCDMEDEKAEPDALEDLKEFQKKVIRHEILHGFFFESGLHECSEYAMNEELVDWVALQFPKLLKAFKEVDVI